MCERTLAVYATWMDVFVNTSGGPQKRRMVFWWARADASVYLRFYKRVAGIRLTYMELDAAALSLNIKCACVYRGAHLLAVNFVNSQMRGWMVSSALHKLFDFFPPPGPSVWFNSIRIWCLFVGLVGFLFSIVLDGFPSWVRWTRDLSVPDSYFLPHFWTMGLITDNLGKE